MRRGGERAPQATTFSNASLEMGSACASHAQEKQHPGEGGCEGKETRVSVSEEKPSDAVPGGRLARGPTTQRGPRETGKAGGVGWTFLSRR